MNAAKKFRPGWDHAFFLNRTLGEEERDKRPRFESTKFKLPECDEFNMERCLRCWRSVGLINNEKWIRQSMASIERWQRRE